VFSTPPRAASYALALIPQADSMWLTSVTDANGLTLNMTTGFAITMPRRRRTACHVQRAVQSEDLT
jgi:hypothetical protein